MDGAVADLHVVGRLLGVTVAGDARRLVIERARVAEPFRRQLEVFLQASLTDSRQRGRLEGIRRVGLVHHVVGRQAELRRRARARDDLGEFPLRQRRVLRVEVDGLHGGRRDGGRPFLRLQQRHVAQEAAGVLLDPDAAVLRHPGPEGVDVVGDGLGLALELVDVDPVEDEVEGRADQPQRDQEDEREPHRDREFSKAHGAGHSSISRPSRSAGQPRVLACL